MSASLVGSEMCIRDRPSGSPRCPGSRHRPSRRRCRAPPGGRPPPRGLGPVSYTHLTLPTICSV
eukprot:1174615-Alexandrium_andersonii.AAC.1